MPNDTIIEALNKKAGDRIAFSIHQEKIRLLINQNSLRRSVIVAIFKKLQLQYHLSKDQSVEILEIHESALPALIHDPEFKRWIATTSEEEELELQFEVEAISEELKANALVMAQDVIMVDKYGQFDANQSRGSDETDILLSQIKNYAETTKKQHEANGFARNKNNVTRFISSEFSFFTKSPLSIKSFEALLDKLYDLAETFPSNIHLFLCTFSVMSPNQSVMNIAVVVECGANPKIHLKSKVHSSSIDPVYKVENRPLPNESGLGVYINIKGITRLITSNPMVFETKGGSSYIQGLDICLDHKYALAMNLYNVFRTGDFAPYQASHIITSNYIRLHPQNCIGMVSHADPFFRLRPDDELVVTDQDEHSIITSAPRVMTLVNPDALYSIESHNASLYQRPKENALHERLIDIVSHQLSELNGDDLSSARQIIFSALKLFKKEYIDQFHDTLANNTKLNSKAYIKPILRLVRNYSSNQSLHEIESHQACLRDVQRAIESQSLVYMPNIIKKGVDLNQTLANGMTPLVYAFHQIRDIEVMIEFIKYLISMGADPNLRLEGKEYPILIAYKLMLAPEILVTLIQCGANCEVSYQDERTLLEEALKRDDAVVLKVLCEHSFLLPEENVACQKVIAKYMREIQRLNIKSRKETVLFSTANEHSDGHKYKEQAPSQYDADHENESNVKQSKHGMEAKLKAHKKK